MLGIALTGGPGSGKSTVLAALHQRGYVCVPESARDIIRERVRRGLAKRPSPHEFAQETLRRDIEQYRRVQQMAGPVFFDRSAVDALGMLDESDPSSATEIQDLLAEFKYFETAFCFPPWREIYRTDSERDQSFREAVAVYDAVTTWYRRCGYQVVDVPLGDVGSRCDFVLSRLP